MSNLATLVNQLREQLKQGQQQVQKLEAAITAIERITVRNSSRAATNNWPKRHLSAAARRRIAEAQRARWAKARKQQAPGSAENKSSSKTLKKRTMSPAARRKIAAAQRARWAKTRGQQQKQAA
jgi:hypothetical protein